MFAKFNPLVAGYSKRENELQKSFDTELEKYNKSKGSIISSFGSSIPEQIERVDFGLIFDCPFTIEEARDLLIRTLVKTQMNLNANKRLKYQFREFPVKKEMIKLCYYSSASCKRQIHDPEKVHQFSINDNSVYYAGYDLENLKLFVLHKETFDEAYQIVFDESMPN